MTASEKILVVRKTILRSKKLAFKKVRGSLNTDFNDLMSWVMVLAFWLRADLELLLRSAYWQDLSINSLGDRICFEQIQLYKQVKKFSNQNQNELIDKEIKELENSLNQRLKKIETNDEILNKLKYRKEVFQGIYDRFYKILSKFVHPDPYSVFFPEAHKDVVESHLLNIFKECSESVDVEWAELINKLKQN